MPVDVLYEDADVVAVDKSPGIVVVPARDEPADQSLHRSLEAARGERLWVVHRLDRDTSGVVVFARNPAAHRSLSMAFEHREVRKTYLALTSPAPDAVEAVIATPLHPARKGRMRPATAAEPGALPSETRYRVDRTARTASGHAVAVLHAWPATGRQHQIRVHLRSIGAPLLVDPIYARVARVAPDALGPGSPPLERLALHSLELDIPLPGGRVRRIVRSPVPTDLATLCAYLERDAQS